MKANFPNRRPTESAMRQTEQELAPGPIAAALAELRESAVGRRSLIDRPIVQEKKERRLWKDCEKCGGSGGGTDPVQVCNRCFGTGRLPSMELIGAPVGIGSQEFIPHDEETRVCPQCAMRGHLVSSEWTRWTHVCADCERKASLPAAPGAPRVVEVRCPKCENSAGMVESCGWFQVCNHG